jgi:hypothetical protein
MELWPGLLALAVALNLLELVMRKWKGLLEALHLAPVDRGDNAGSDSELVR